MDRVLVTGGASGIGRAIVERLSADGLTCVAIDRNKPKGSFPGEWIEANALDADSMAAALRSALMAGPITRLINNVGAVRPASLEETTLEDLDAVVAVNLRTSLQCVQALLPGMKRAGFGRIVNVSSRAALGKELRSAYAASKAGLHGFTKTWALELGRHGITVNAVGPGPIRTALFDASNPADSARTKAIMMAIPVGRMGEPEDVAHAVAFLVDARSGFITGQILYVCGGMTVGIVE
ncbi:MAG: SDR family oxidoreductase [Pseudorhodoplanes sp.]|nr:MAG: SDR family oxidoreductase [Pseudorhodoplanes sp.]